MLFKHVNIKLIGYILTPANDLVIIKNVLRDARQRSAQTIKQITQIGTRLLIAGFGPEQDSKPLTRKRPFAVEQYQRDHLMRPHLGGAGHQRIVFCRLKLPQQADRHHSALYGHTLLLLVWMSHRLHRVSLYIHRTFAFSPFLAASLPKKEKDIFGG